MYTGKLLGLFSSTNLLVNKSTVGPSMYAIVILALRKNIDSSCKPKRDILHATIYGEDADISPHHSGKRDGRQILPHWQEMKGARIRHHYGCLLLRTSVLKHFPATSLAYRWLPLQRNMQNAAEPLQL
jgi:hypothetical protein